ncbi:MAG TPA: rhodanese-like domain-containing protein [Aggregatilinea sp.]|uniref:rhodanese-like domain-containing protein n=1 Tax=Aggregatilinea sp. TaxID=2806333 RepID=UPI002D190466|nr:rhodanese-like domain-containing protein [Aggregatilinea sp.]HML20869.1 rhodanese-like domain-containing protein [Aggregatilinea sp.]
MNLIKQLFASTDTNLDAAEAKSKLDGKNPPVLLDVRQQDEYRSGHIPGAVLIPLNQLGQRLHELPKDREIICVCRSGSRSRMANRMLAQAGYNSLNLKGGMISWTRAGLSTKKGNTP